MLKRLALIPIAAAAFLASAAGGAIAGEELVMVEEHGCFWCARWDRDIAAVYPKTPEGQAAPLRRVDIHGPMPEDLEFARMPVYTPTFILVSDGREVARIEGYPGEDFFWGLLGMMLEANTDFELEGAS